MSSSQKSPKKSPKTTVAAQGVSPPGKKQGSSSDPGIPKAVSDRMVSRVAFFSGVPTALGMLTFVVSYFIVKQELFKLPHSAVVLVSMGFFGLGVLGLSYGALSASWDEDSPGSILGWQEFALNFGRLRSAWRSKT